MYAFVVLSLHVYCQPYRSLDRNDIIPIFKDDLMTESAILKEIYISQHTLESTMNTIGSVVYMLNATNLCWTGSDCGK